MWGGGGGVFGTVGDIIMHVGNITFSCSVLWGHNMKCMGDVQFSHIYHDNLHGTQDIPHDVKHSPRY